MNRFAFTVTAATQTYCDEVVRCLMEFGGTNKDEAVALVNEYWHKDPTFDENDFRLHESPYFWAMCIIHDPTLGDNYPGWWMDPAYWPPPKSFTSRWYRTRANDADG